MFVGLNQTPQPLGKAKARPAFTLIELLVVIAIIAVLAALLLPALARAKAAANTTACRSNARQLAICLAMYADEYTAYPFSVDFKRQLMWYDQLTPFYENTGRVNTNPTNQNKLLLCPAYKGGSGVTVWSPNYFGYRGGAMVTTDLAPNPSAIFTSTPAERIAPSASAGRAALFRRNQ